MWGILPPPPNTFFVLYFNTFLENIGEIQIREHILSQNPIDENILSAKLVVLQNLITRKPQNVNFFIRKSPMWTIFMHKSQIVDLLRNFF